VDQAPAPSASSRRRGSHPRARAGAAPRLTGVRDIDESLDSPLARDPLTLSMDRCGLHDLPPDARPPAWPICTGSRSPTTTSRSRPSRRLPTSNLRFAEFTPTPVDRSSSSGTTAG
jgi:hypothetical protein